MIEANTSGFILRTSSPYVLIPFFQISGKRGFAPKTFLKEYKVLQRILSYEVPVYKFTDEVKDEVQTRTEKVHEVHLLKDKLPHDDNEMLSSSVKSLDKNIQGANIESEKLESTEKIHEVHSFIKDNLFHDDNEMPLLSAQSVDKTVLEIGTTNVDSILPSYEVLDGTTFYFESKPSTQQKFASEAMHVTALPNEQASVSHINSKIDSDNNDDRTIFINKKEVRHDTNDFNNKEIKVLIDIPEETNTKTLLKNAEAIINPTTGTVRKDDVLLHDVISKSDTDELSKNLENEDKLVDSSAEKNIEYKKEEATENIENESIFASFARKFNILSDSLETATTDTTTSLNNNDLSTFEVNTESKAVDKESIPATETLLSINPSIMSKDDIEIQQEIIHESIHTTKFSNEKIKSEKEKITVSLENAASHDVPLSNNFVHENHKPAQDVSIESSVLMNNSSVSKEADISSNAKNIKIQEASKDKKIIENIETEGAITSLVEESVVSSVKETTIITSISTQSNDIEQTSQESDKAYLENAKKDIYKESIIQVNDAAVDEIPEISNLLSVENTPENVTKEALSVVKEGTVIIDNSLNRNAADIQLNPKSIVHNNVNKNDNLVYDASSGKVPIESNEFFNGVKSSIVSPEQSADSSQKNMISEGKWVFDEYLHNRNLASTKEDFEHRNGEYCDLLVIYKNIYIKIF